MAGATFWNSLADELRTYSSDRFKLALKTFLFASYCHIQRIRGFRGDALYKLMIDIDIVTVCAVQLTQWSIHNTGRKIADFALHAGSSGPFLSVGANGQKQYHSPRGKLFAIDAEGQHLLTCAPHGGLIYKVVMCVCLDAFIKVFSVFLFKAATYCVCLDACIKVFSVFLFKAATYYDCLDASIKVFSVFSFSGNLPS